MAEISKDRRFFEEIVTRMGKRPDKPLTVATLIAAVKEMNTKEESISFTAGYREFMISEDGINDRPVGFAVDQITEELVIDLISTYMGYVDEQDFQHFAKLGFKHPVFGTTFTNANDAFRMGVQLGANNMLREMQLATAGYQEHEIITPNKKLIIPG